MKIQDFNERLKNSILIADGAMGSYLHESVGTIRCFDELNAMEPEAVFRAHQAYIEAGAQIIETNTFGANRFKSRYNWRYECRPKWSTIAMTSSPEGRSRTRSCHRYGLPRRSGRKAG